MKAALIAVVLALAGCATTTSPSPSLDRVFAGADRVVILRGSLCHQWRGVRELKSVDGEPDAGAVLHQLSVKSKAQGVLACCPDYTLQVYAKGEELGWIGFIGASTLRWKRDKVSWDFILTDGASAYLKRSLGFVDEPDERELRANQTPQHNAGSRPSSGDSKAPETPSLLGPRG